MFSRIKIVEGDITKMNVDAIVNAANSTLRGGGGVDGAIHRAAGPELLEECRKIGGCPTGEARITKGYKLPAKYVIHTVGPVWYGGTQNEHHMLASSYTESLRLAAKNMVATLAFPSISTGAYRFPVEKAAPIAIKAIKEHLKTASLPETVYMVCFDKAVFEAYSRALREQSGDL
jgi:O-acetyl-ADP-ribose deacetylase (regulator of RNase III)